MIDETVPSVVRELVVELASTTPMRRGSVSERSMKCGQKRCRCQHDRQALHGPYYSLTRIEGGKTRSRYLSTEQAALARQQVEAGHQFRKKVDAYWEACEKWADAQLLEPDAALPGEAKKGASERLSKR